VEKKFFKNIPYSFEVELAARMYIREATKRVLRQRLELDEVEMVGDTANDLLESQDIAAILDLYSKGISKFPDCSFLQLHGACFTMFVGGHVTKGKQYLAKIRRNRPSLDIRYGVECAEKTQFQLTSQAADAGENHIDVMQAFEFSSGIRRAKADAKRCQASMVLFWNAVARKADMSALQVICKEIHSHRALATSAFKQLLENFPNSVEAIRAYSVFISQCEDNFTMSEQLLHYAQELEDQASAQRRKKRVKGVRSPKASVSEAAPGLPAPEGSETQSNPDKHSAKDSARVSSSKGSENSNTLLSSEGNSALDTIRTQYMVQGTANESVKVGKSINILKYSMLAFMVTLLVSLILLFSAYSGVITSATATGARMGAAGGNRHFAAVIYGQVRQLIEGAHKPSADLTPFREAIVTNALAIQASLDALDIAEEPLVQELWQNTPYQAVFFAPTTLVRFNESVSLLRFYDQFIE